MPSGVPGMSEKDAATRIVVTGLGVVSPVGIGVEPFHEALCRGESGVGVIDLPWPTGYATNRAGVVDAFGPPGFLAGRGNPNRPRALCFARTAGRMALEQAGLGEREGLRRDSGAGRSG